MSEPKHLTVEYDDGSTKTIDFSKLDKDVCLALANLNLCPHQALIGTSKHYVLLEWDGWQEVVGVDRESVELVRYYVIRRIEDRGRLSFEVGSDDPELFIVKRLPRELKGVLIAGASGMRAYDFSSETERWEGIFESAGKIEYVKYDKTDPGYQRGPAETAARVPHLREALQGELAKRGFGPRELLVAEESQRLEVYREIATGMGIRGKERQADVYGFIELLVKQLAKASATTTAARSTPS